MLNILNIKQLNLDFWNLRLCQHNSEPLSIWDYDLCDIKFGHDLDPLGKVFKVFLEMPKTMSSGWIHLILVIKVHEPPGWLSDDCLLPEDSLFFFDVLDENSC